ncbi:arylsulfatase [Halolamina pelagica]|uniref:Arylsulfatase n=1 Tax=Halolamina pelagica TaxID=699431 RepID=A0A0N8I0H5_9EURY|nr:sulfatase-like hydrolase/transferase [Halolamina pelagica]KPN32323.1 arylsulfatase [Halolamina pelagica]
MSEDSGLLDSIRDQLTKHALPYYSFAINRWNRFQQSSRGDIPKLHLNGRDVVIVVIDCLRADRLSRTGYHRQTTPFLDTIDMHRTAVSAAPWTYAAVPSILSGLFPHNHGAGYVGDYRDRGSDDGEMTSLLDETILLPELFDAAGYETYFSTAIATAELSVRGHLPHCKIAHETPADELVSEFLEWWEQTEGPRFSYLHLGDLHEPLTVPNEKPFGDIPDVDGLRRWRYQQANFGPGFNQYREARKKLYDTALYFVDQQLNRLMSHLPDDALVVITSDHGEEMWDRVELSEQYFAGKRGIYGVGHGHALIPEVLDVPLFMDGVKAADGVVSTVDIAPNILSESGVEDPSSLQFDGQQFSEIMEERVAHAGEIGHGLDQQAVVTDRWMLTRVSESDDYILIDRECGEVTENKGVVESLNKHFPNRGHSGPQQEIDKETQDRLSDLGYIS